MTVAARVAWYRFRATFSDRLGGYLAIVVLVALVGGIAMFALAGARRTQASFPAYLSHVDASDLGVLTAIVAPGAGTQPYDAKTVEAIARLPHVKQVASFTIVNPNITTIGTSTLHIRPGEAPPTIGGSLDGEFSKLDRATLASGRLADPNRADEVVMTAGAARELGSRVGSRTRVAFFTNRQLQLPHCCSAEGKGALAPHLEVDLRLVGIVVQHTQVIEDDVDALSDNWVLLSPTLMRKLVPCCAFATETGIAVDGGNRNVAAVESEMGRAIPRLSGRGALGGAQRTSTEEAKVERAVEPESIALGVFGGIAAVAVLLIGAQLIGRQVRRQSAESWVLRAMGGSPVMSAADNLLGVSAAITAGALLASVLAAGMSPLAPLGPIRRVESPSVALDWTVLGGGTVALVVALSGIAMLIAYRESPYRLARAPGRIHPRRSRISRAATNAGLPLPLSTGARFALDGGPPPNAVPVRSAILGAFLAVVVVTSTVTFGASLRTLVTRPALYGWNWNYQLLSGFSGQEDLPGPQLAALLRHDRFVSAWSGVYFTGASIDGRTVPVIGTTPNAAIAPPQLSGHGLEHPDEIVLGATTLAELHKRVGDTVAVAVARSGVTRLRIVGTATFPTIGSSGGHATMGNGALLAYQLIPANRRNLQQSPVPGPNAVLVRARGGDAAAALASLQRINDILNTPRGGGGDSAAGVVGVLRPAEIVNYRSMNGTAALLGSALAAGTLGALALTLLASVRRRRRDLALLKTLGFTRSQLAGSVVWQSSIAVTGGLVFGVPIGILAGRALWKLFADAIHAVDRPTVPAITIALIATGALVLAIVVAIIPAFQAARTATAELLQSE